MDIEAPLSRHAKNSLIIFILASLAFAAWTAYDGFFHESYIKEHTGENGEPDSTLLFNQQAPPYLLALAGLAGLRLFQIRKRKIVATENAVVINKRTQIAYDAIQQIDKTYFEKKGFFDVSYTNAGGKPRKVRFDDRKYDNMRAVLQHLVERIS